MSRLAPSRLWLARLLIFAVAAWNLQAALAFIGWPDSYAPGFELSGVPGAVAVRGTGLLFLMWNIAYLLALWQPVRYRLALLLAVTMQAVGVVGESLILVGLPLAHATLRASLLRFIVFDGMGLALLILACFLVKKRDHRFDS